MVFFWLDRAWSAVSKEGLFRKLHIPDMAIARRSVEGGPAAAIPHKRTSLLDPKPSHQSP